MENEARLTKILGIIMRFSMVQLAVMVLFTSISFANESKSQEILDEQVTINVQSVEVKKILSEIEKQTSAKFVFSNNTIRGSNLITLNAESEKLSNVLTALLKPLGITYEVAGSRILLVKYRLDKEEGASSLLEDPSRIRTPAAQGGVIRQLVALTIRGRVVNEIGFPEIGVTVIVKETQKGAFTNENGEFVLEDVPEDAILVVSAINIVTQEIPVAGRSVINIVVRYSTSILEEVQVIGYGTTIRRLQTGSVSSVKSDVLERQSVTNPIEALQGRASGLYITNTAGAVGAAPTIQIRGVSTLNTGVPVASQPLYVLDGAIIPGSGIVASFGTGSLNATLGSYWGNEGGVNPFTFLNPNDIESIEVLKDADATAIYGSRGTNGVIIITTKKGKAGATKFNFDFNTGITQASYLPERLNTQQFRQLRRDAFAMGNPTTTNPLVPIVPTASNAPDLVTWDSTAYNDWTRFEFDNPARNLNLQGNISGGIKEFNYLASLGFVRNEDITRGDPFQERFSGLLNLNSSSRNNKFTIALSNNISSDNLKPSTGTLVFPATMRALPPNMPLTNSDGTPFWPTNSMTSNVQNFIPNPTAGEFVNVRSNTFSFINNINAAYKLLDFLTLRLQTGYTNQLNKSFTTIPSNSINPLVPGTVTPRRSESESMFQTFNIEPQLNIQKDFGRGKFEGLIGTTFFEKSTKTFGIEVDGYDTDALLGSWAGGRSVANKASTLFKYRFNSVFARANYNFDGKYLLNGTFRRDGSSRFGPENQWANFASIGSGWVFTKEKFLSDNTILSYGKIRGSYGTTGNDNINDFRFTSLFTSTNIIYGNLIGLAPSFLSVPGFKWENTTKLDFALELGFAKDRFLFNVNWFKNQSTDLLVNQRIPSQTGFSSYLGNFPGVIENKGWEIDLTTNNLSPKSAFSWKTNFNISLLKNTLVEYPDLENSPNSSNLRLGEAILNPAFPSTLMRAFTFEGVNQADGLPIFRDINGDGVISTSGFNDREFVGTTFPKYYGGINNSFSYKGFTLEVFVNFARQLTTTHLYLSPTTGQIFNPVYDYYGNYWTKPGDETKYPRLYTGVGTQNVLLSNYFSNSTAAISDVFFARLRNLSLTYKLPNSWAQKLKMGSINVYARGQNLLTYTSKEIYKDPEVMNPRGVIPRTIITGINVSF
jgi:TonB-linked SusC/RagA family outer membrane protein